MARVIKAPAITFTCGHCGAVCSGEPEEFVGRYTMPPTWEIQCPYCRLLVVCSPTALIARFIARLVGNMEELPHVTCTIIEDASPIDSEIRSLPPRR